mmetsp:Transcript_15479/g.25319  ORF Transcript_15479/g.25319 Transcript_15479/m.25319 type:complete len:283 (+) Transcript_15479:56-904(+)|eukprot:CAMPEP_0203748868 /NCGR_PEP_ID=MMETSP0098-20131031/3628_1 /ASSEMBLY_ACC=CAM_ASM_000208 /TAXON_ID=96639 /ORGANISM=" , Strain NY0313808BC1" /LENGTH=282 /DNA_ID=CAMNT_0050637763 /DNA_START=357 /DNA_END=1205 /DNA_ORIENTATION=-
MKVNILLVAGFCAGSAVHGESLADSLQASLRASLGKVNKKNHPVCHEIVGSGGWWDQRVVQMDPDRDVVPSDQKCMAFNNNREKCLYKSAREDGDDKDVACTLVGAHSGQCVGNPCNSYNMGNCTIQQTAGQCVWLTDENLAIVNAQYASIGRATLTGHGCYRNMCNIPGLGRSTRETCFQNSIPLPGKVMTSDINQSTDDFLFKCTYCAGAGDTLLKGKGVGCQIDHLETDSKCAYVNSRGIPKSSIFRRKANHKCQCSDEYSNCKSLVTGRDASDFEPVP